MWLAGSSLKTPGLDNHINGSNVVVVLFLWHVIYRSPGRSLEVFKDSSGVLTCSKRENNTTPFSSSLIVLDSGAIKRMAKHVGLTKGGMSAGHISIPSNNNFLTVVLKIISFPSGNIDDRNPDTASIMPGFIASIV